MTWGPCHEALLCRGTALFAVALFQEAQASTPGHRPCLQSERRGKNLEVDELKDNRWIPFLPQSTRSVTDGWEVPKADRTRPLTILGGVSQVLQCGHGCLCPLNVLFSFCDVQVLGGRLLGGFCCWLRKNMIPKRPSGRPTVTQISQHDIGRQNKCSHATLCNISFTWHLEKSAAPIKPYFPKRKLIANTQLLWKASCYTFLP